MSTLFCGNTQIDQGRINLLYFFSLLFSFSLFYLDMCMSCATSNSQSLNVHEIMKRGGVHCTHASEHHISLFLFRLK